MDTGKPSSRYRFRRAALLGVLVSAVFVYFTLRGVDAGKVLEETARVAVPILLLSLVTKLGGFLFMTWRSLWMTRSLHVFGFSRMFRSILVTFAGNALLPLRAGEFLRVDYLANTSGVPHSAFLAVIGVERLIDTFCLLLLLGLTVPSVLVQASNVGWLIGLGVAVTAFLVFAALAARNPALLVGCARSLFRVFGERISAWISARTERFALGLKTLTSPGAVVVVILLTLGYWATSLASIRIWLWAYSLELPWYAPLVVIAFSSFGTALPSSPGFVGTYHYFVSSALLTLGVGPDVATSFAFVGHAVALVPFTVISVVVLFIDGWRKDLPILRWANPPGRT